LDKIVSIECIGREHVYDIEREKAGAEVYHADNAG
jgi:hypothetical protein